MTINKLSLLLLFLYAMIGLSLLFLAACSFTVQTIHVENDGQYFKVEQEELFT